MKVDLSPSEIGAVIYAIQTVYQDNTDEASLAQRLADEVYNSLGSDFFDAWIQEFDIEVF